MKSPKRRRATVALLTAGVLLASTPVSAAPLADAPGAPGTGAAWTTGGKEGFGTATNAASKVWFTLGQGINHEIYYPTVDVANVQDLQYVVSDGAGFTQLERDHTTKQLVLTDPRSLSYRQINTATNGRYRITKTHTADPARSTVLIQTRFEVLSGGPLQLYALYNPSLNNSGMGDTGATSGGQLVASDGPVSSAMAASTGFVKATSGYSGTASDGYVDLSGDHVLGTQYDSASTPGNLVQLGQIPVGTDTTFTLAIGFGGDRGAASANASASLAGGFGAADTAYRSGWSGYLSSLAAVPRSITGAGLTTQYNVALMTLKAHEDKTYSGANVASLTNPWGEAKDANGTGDCGYHAVWSRDLYQVSTAQIAAGDSAAANRSVDYLFTVQQRPDGSFPQNTRLDGTNCWTSLQMDEVAFPIVLAWQLGRSDAGMWAKVKKSADFLVANGPSTPQERWEENGGYSPSTIAAEIAGLICAADIAERNGDTTAAARYRETADRWQAQVSAWTFTTSGPLGDGRYFHRIDGNGNPNDGQNVFLQNGGGNHDERAIIDAGFLDLVRLGVKPPADPDVAASLSEVDSTLKVNTPNGPMWYRYNHDGYGETASGGPYTGAGVGRLWPLLTGERGEYELANGRPATTHLAAMAASANPGFLIPEQVWDRQSAGGFTFGEGTGSATPLAWSMAQFVRLAHSIDAGAPVETPSVVKQRYSAACSAVSAKFTVNATTSWGQNIFVVGDRPELGAWNPANAVPMSSAGYPLWTANVTLPKGAAFQYKYIRKEGGAVTWESGANRAGTASSGCTMALNDTWRP
ncbi:glucan 1,4-alpha-glucosidase [Amycolatopsis roodepoortensis]|uniref:glucan 1,4-alpha-glucosidase n=1 Tax=Amycolatopsis roodepoortensis TaxID=700274 RepID=UPI00214AFB8A|nr:glucan 1,4-alpha-glucosidase [Amycolatopsis roodepoortensis]UUV31437.1 glucan 1,4-alpha-glucosidase [Amycolatopsis roodepoortensis]